MGPTLRTASEANIGTLYGPGTSVSSGLLSGHLTPSPYSYAYSWRVCVKAAWS